MRRFARRSGCMVWALAGGMGLIALCAALGAGLSVIRAAAADQPVPHLPTPVPVRPPGAVVEWKRVPETGPAAENPAAPYDVESEPVTQVGEWMEVSAAPIAVQAQSQIMVPEREVGVPAIEEQPEPVPGAPGIRLPLDGRVTQGFGCSPYYTGIPGPGCPADAFWFHDGVDIAAPIGTPVQAGMSGTVVFAAADGDGPLCNRGYRGYGLAVLVDGGNGWPPGRGWQALYAHLSRIDVAIGDVVRPDTVLGASGDTGCVSGAHLHFGLRHDGKLVDPLEFVR
jgi:murein DD-endopeptidase MepM/ murein hydrolase activator NlpD